MMGPGCTGSPDSEVHHGTCAVPVLQLHDEAMGVGLLCGLHHHLEGHGGQAVGNVVCDGAGEQHGLLAYQRDLWGVESKLARRSWP